jgi:hypothetical protein
MTRIFFTKQYTHRTNLHALDTFPPRPVLQNQVARRIPAVSFLSLILLYSVNKCYWWLVIYNKLPFLLIFNNSLFMRERPLVDILVPSGTINVHCSCILLVEMCNSLSIFSVWTSSHHSGTRDGSITISFLSTWSKTDNMEFFPLNHGRRNYQK